MTCCLKSLPALPDLDTVRGHLFPHRLLQGESVQDDDYDNRWSWDDGREEAVQSSDNEGGNKPWLSQCVISFSPDGSILVIALGCRIAVYSLKNEVLWTQPICKTLDGFATFERISCISLIPMASHLKTNEGGIDWTALLIGSNHGILRVYTENGFPLLHQKFSEEEILSIKCSSFFSPSLSGLHVFPPDTDQTDQVVMSLASKLVVTIEGFALYDTLRFARNHLVKNPAEISSLLDMKISIPSSKWLLSDSRMIRDVASPGELTTTTYDDLVTVSFRGPNARVQQKDLKDRTTSNLITTGETPYIGFYQTKRSEVNSVLSNVAQAVVNKAKNFLPIFSHKTDEEQQESPPVHLRANINLFDEHREGSTIVMSPDKRLAAISDDFGRVCLLDINCKLVIRMWKGYRDAQCSFVMINEDNKLQSRKSLCLVIYAPKRGLLEIWKLQMGPRIAGFNIGKKCILLSFNHSVFGLTRKMVERMGYPERNVYVFDLKTCQIFKVDIPFACTLTDDSSVNVKDGHLLKELFKAFAERDSNKQLIILKQLHSISSQVEAVEASLEVLENAVFVSRSFVDILNDRKEGDQDLGEVLSVEEKLFYQSCQRVLQLAGLYRQLSSFDSLTVPTSNLHHHHPSDIEAVSQSMGWKPIDVAKCLSLFSLRHSVIPPNVKETTSRTFLDFQTFVTCFAIQTTQVVKAGDDASGLLLQDIPVDVNWSSRKDSTRNFESLSKFVAEVIFDESTDVNDLLSAFKESQLSPKSLLKLLFNCWLSSPSLADNWNNWAKLTSVARTFGMDLVEDITHDQKLSHSWKVICGLTISSQNIPSALISLVTVKTVTEELSSEKTKKAENPDEVDLGVDDEWETLHVDKERLNIVIKQLEDIFLLNLLLSCDKRFSIEPLSLIQLMNGESGLVSELVSKWMISLSLDVLTLFKPSETSKDTEDDVEKGSEDFTLRQLKSQENVQELVLHVSRCFPHSLRREVILINCCWESVKLWMSSPTVTQGSLLSQSLTYLNALERNDLKHNLACLLWKTFILVQLDVLSSLSEKMGKIPKDRICKKEISMGEDCLETFLNFTHDLLEIIIENIQVSHDEDNDRIEFKVDDWWRKKDSNERRPPLAFLVLSVKASNPSIVLSHIHLTQVLLFMSVFQMRGCRPLSLFSSTTRQVLFGDLHYRSYDPPQSAYSLNEKRRQFLEQVVASIAQSIPTTDSSSPQDNLLLTPSRMFAVANKWFRICLTLSREWEMDIDPLRRLYVCHLYANGCDSLAEEIRNSCRDATRLSLDLLPVFCQRILIEGNVSLLSLPPYVMQWMRDMKCPYNVVSSTSCGHLLDFIRVNLPEDSTDLKNITILRDHLPSS